MFENTLCSKCFGCNRLELEKKYFQGVYSCVGFVAAETEKKQQTVKLKTKKVCQAISTIHAILGIQQIQAAEGEQLRID